jgi:hypothetical protein
MLAQAIVSKPIQAGYLRLYQHVGEATRAPVKSPKIVAGKADSFAEGPI